jgi:hypothetical protein
VKKNVANNQREITSFFKKKWYICLIILYGRTIICCE